MSITKTLTGRCEICQKEFHGSRPLVLAQVIGFHKRKAHGIMGASNDPEKKRRYGRMQYYKKIGLSPREIEEKEAKYEATRRAVAPNGQLPPEHPVKRREPTKRPAANNAEPMALKECPYCHSRFYGVRGQEA